MTCRCCWRLPDILVFPKWWSRRLHLLSLGFRIVHLLLPGSQISVWHLYVLLFRFCYLCHTNPLGDTMISSILYSKMPTNWSADHRPCSSLACLCCFCFFLVLLCLVFCVCFVAVLLLHGVSQWIVYWSSSVLFCMHIVVTTDVAAALTRLICKMQLSFRLDKRPGESHLALDGKKTIYAEGPVQSFWDKLCSRRIESPSFLKRIQDTGAGDWYKSSQRQSSVPGTHREKIARTPG